MVPGRRGVVALQSGNWIVSVGRGSEANTCSYRKEARGAGWKEFAINALSGRSGGCGGLSIRREGLAAAGCAILSLDYPYTVDYRCDSLLLGAAVYPALRTQNIDVRPGAKNSCGPGATMWLANQPEMAVELPASLWGPTIVSSVSFQVV